MIERRPAAGEEAAPRSSAPMNLSIRPSRGSPQPSTAPIGISTAGLLGIAGYALVRLTMPPDEVASECLQAALGDRTAARSDASLDIELVTTGKLDGARRASGALADPVRRRAIEHCRALYAQQTGVSASAPLLEVDTAVVPVAVARSIGPSGAPPAAIHHPASGALVSVANLSRQGSCVTSRSGQCELTLWGVAHDAKLTIVAQLDDGVTVSRSTTLLELLHRGSTLELQQRTPTPSPRAADCSATRLSLENAAQFTPVPPDAAGHQLDAGVDVSSSGRVTRVAANGNADRKALVALRSQLATLPRLAGPCHDLRVSLHY